MTVNAAFFYLFATVTVASAFMVIASRNPVQSVLFLILAFVNAAGLFVMMGAEFLAMILVIVYVGAVAVLFLFVVMMLDVDFAELRQGFLQYLPVGVLIGIIFFVELAMVIGIWVLDPTLIRSPAVPIPSPSLMTNTLRLFLPGCRPNPAGSDDRCDRAHSPHPHWRQAPGHLPTECSHPGDGRRASQGALPARRVRTRAWLSDWVIT